MTVYALHVSGDCNPWTCLACAVECDVCGKHLDACICPVYTEDDE